MDRYLRMGAAGLQGFGQVILFYVLDFFVNILSNLTNFST
jgi:hypothetical protein